MTVPQDQSQSLPHRQRMSSLKRESLGVTTTVQNRRSFSASSPEHSPSEQSSQESLVWSDASGDSDGPLTPSSSSPIQNNSSAAQPDAEHLTEIDLTPSNLTRASTTLLTQDSETLKIQDSNGETGTQLIQKYCCGGGCCFLNPPPTLDSAGIFKPIGLPTNDAFRSLKLKLGALSSETELTGVPQLPERKVSFEHFPTYGPTPHHSSGKHPPPFVKPHPPYDVFSAPIYHARELTKPGAEKRTFHFDIDVTDYPDEAGVDFKVGGAIGICPPNPPAAVDEIFNTLGVPSFIRDKPVLLHTTGGRWPTIWGDDHPRELITSRRELLTWCSDIQSYAPTKTLFRIMAEHATDPQEKQILFYLSSAQGQSAFCDLRTGPHLSLTQLLHAFPSSKPPIEDIFSVLEQIMPRFYSLSNDPHVSSARDGLAGRRLIEIAVTVHETPDWRNGSRSGVGSGFLERMAKDFIAAEQRGEVVAGRADLRIPLFRGLMANPLSKEFGVSDGPMMLIGAGVGMAPFRGFILNRLRNANCASKIWLVQGVRDSSLDELYSGELGQYEGEIKRVVQSRAGSRRRGSAAPSATSSTTDLTKTLTNDGEKRKEESPPPSGNSGGGLLKEATDRARERPSRRWNGDVDAQTESRYVQDEVRHQGDIVWDVINSIDGRVFVCGSSKGMGEGVEQALRDVAMKKGGFAPEGAKAFWDEMKEAGKYIAETW